MDAYRLNVKVDLEPSAEIDPERLIPIFHRLIRTGLGDELLIDVADYKHVASGPGVMLIAHEANYSVDGADGRLGLLYGRKRPAEGGFGERLRDAFARILRFGLALENEPDLAGLAVATDRWSLRIHDRLLAPNSDETFAAVAPELRAVLGDLFPEAEPELAREGDPRASFGVRIAVPVKPGLALLADRLSASEVPAALAA